RKGITAAAIEPVCFERILEPLTKERVLAALRDALPQNAELDLIDFTHSKLPKGTLEFPRAGLPKVTPREVAIWKGRMKYAAAQSVPVWAKVQAWTSRSVMVAVEDLRVGKPIAPSH